MKYTVAILTFTFTLSFTAVGRASGKTTSSGIYLTADDFANGKLTYEGRDGDSSHKLQVHDVRLRPYVDVRHDNEITRLNKSDIYGFRDGHGKSYRFVGHDAYEILESGPLHIYRTYRSVPIRKGAVATEAAYFFSVGPEKPLVPLTIANLKGEVAKDSRLQDSLDITFRNDSDLIRFDKSHSTYAVNRLLRATTPPIALNKSQSEPMNHMMVNCMENCQMAHCAS